MRIKRIVDGKEITFRLTSEEIKKILKIHSIEKGRELIQRAYDNLEIGTIEFKALYRDKESMYYLYEELVEEALYNSSDMQREIVRDYAREVRKTV